MICQQSRGIGRTAAWAARRARKEARESTPEKYPMLWETIKREFQIEACCYRVVLKWVLMEKANV